MLFSDDLHVGTYASSFVNCVMFLHIWAYGHNMGTADGHSTYRLTNHQFPTCWLEGTCTMLCRRRPWQIIL